MFHLFHKSVSPKFISDSAFYAFPRLQTELPLNIVKRLIREFRMAVMPGSTFGIDEGCYLRSTYGALDETTLVEVLRRLVNGLNLTLR